MKKISILVILLFVVAFVIQGKAFAQKDGNTQKPVKVSEAAKPAEPAESTEAAGSDEKLIPYSAAYNSPGTGADRANADEDSE